jgi:uncharacterized protein (TIGR02453 family)
MAFRGWPAEALEFYEGLAADNSKAFWTAHKAVYDQCVYAPMAELLAELADEFGPGKIFRPYRDVRFSADKTPYKTAIGASLERGGYVQLSAEGLAAGSGMYHLMPDQLDRFRSAVADDKTGTEITDLIGQVRRKGIDISAHDMLKTVPRGYPRDHPRAELLRHKGLITWQRWPAGKWLGTATAKRRVVEFLHTSQPISDWLAAHVGESTMPARER